MWLISSDDINSLTKKSHPNGKPHKIRCSRTCIQIKNLNKFPYIKIKKKNVWKCEIEEEAVKCTKLKPYLIQARQKATKTPYYM